MSLLLELPKSDKEAAIALQCGLRGATRSRNQQAIEWWMAHYYLMGARNFRVLDWNKGTLRVGFENDDGEIDFRWEKVLVEYQTELGRLMRMDVHPATSWTGTTLDGMRKAAIGKAVLTNKVAKMELERIKRTLLQQQLKYGTVGLMPWEFRRPQPGSVDEEGNEIEGALGEYEYAFDIVPPWQLLSIPDAPETEGDLQAIVRERVVPWSWMETELKRRGWPVPNKKDAELQIRSMPLGSRHITYGPEMGGDELLGMDVRFGTSGSEQKNNPEVQDVVTYQEVFTLGPSNTCAEYLVKVGQKILGRENYWKRGERVVMPMGIGRYTPTDTFYGRSFVTRLLGLNDQVERMLRNLFENVQDMDEFGFLFIPNNLGVNKRELKKTTKPRAIFYSPDYTMPESRPYEVNPATTGEFPGRVATMAVQLQSQISGQSELFAGGAPGRTESGTSLGFLYETSSIPLAVPASEIEKIFVQAYSCLLQKCGRNYEEGSTLLLHAIDDAVAGVVLSPDGTLALADNPIPEPWDMQIGIADSMPRPKEVRKQELIQMLQLGIIDPLQFRLINYREDLGFPVGNKAEWHAYSKAVFQNIMLFGNGTDPGAVKPNQMEDIPSIQLFAIQDFMTTIQYSLASSRVRAAFEERKQIYERMLGQAPEGLPPPEEAAMMAMGQNPAGLGDLMTGAPPEEELSL